MTLTTGEMGDRGLSSREKSEKLAVPDPTSPLTSTAYTVMLLEPACRAVNGIVSVFGEHCEVCFVLATII
jgi:hypothetical protein